jgi:cyclophilin family peptidyl-prolyl cis-trans isomerase
MKYLHILLILVLTTNCQQKAEKQQTTQEEQIQVELTTSKGVIVLELSNKTPLHRDNFIKVINEGTLDSMLFHRIIEGFMVQAGEFDSTRMAEYDSIELKKNDYLVPAEFDTSLFHKRGALGAARNGNPERASASLSFYIVQRGPRADSLINVDEKRINEWLQQHYFINSLKNRAWKDSLSNAEAEQNWKLFSELSDTINLMAKSFEFNAYEIPEYQRELYRTQGGTPHLDQNYTVFGEVVSGMAVVDSIAIVGVNDSARPFENVYIIAARVLER